MKHLPLYTAIASISLLSACSGGTAPTGPSINQAPVISVMQDITGTVGRSIVVDASESFDPEGEALSVSWALTRAPSSSQPTVDINFDTLTITPDAPGIYKLEVIIEDGEMSASKVINVFAMNPGQESDNNDDVNDSDNTNNDTSNTDSNNDPDNSNTDNSNTDTNNNDNDSSDNTIDDSSSDDTHSDDSNSDMQNTDCQIQTYNAGATYDQGDVVINNSSYFYCNVSGWCSSNAAFAYEPGVGAAWQSAWASIAVSQACAIEQEDPDDNNNTNIDDATDDNADTSSDNNTDTNNSNDNDTSDSSDQTDNSDTDNSTDSHESWMDIVDTTDWPKALKNTNVSFNNSDTKVVGTYFVEWGVYGRNFHVADIPAANLTHILYGFIPVCGPNDSLMAANATGHAALVSQCADKQDYEVTIHDKYAALEKTYPGDKWDDKIKGNFGQLMRLKAAQPEIKILPSIGGWTLSDPLFDLDNQANRTVFINSVIEFLTTYEFFDGVDIDWEFPGGGGANSNLGSAKDGPTYVILMAELRSALNILSAQTGKDYEITSAIGTSPKMIAAVDYGQATQYMDYIFMMTYDYKGSWSTEMGHQTNLYASNQTADDSLSIEISVDAILAQGVDSTKLVVGIAKYGRGWKAITGANESNPFDGQGNGAIDGTWENGILDYKDIEANYMGGKNGQGINGWEYRWDESAQAPYLWNSSKKELISFDDQRSVKAKGNFAVQRNLGGLFSWEIDADTGSILNAMHEGLGHSKN